MKKDPFIQATTIADSVHLRTADRLLTLLVTMPKCIQAQFNTHRSLSKNSASSRAIPTKRFRKMARERTYYPPFTIVGKGMEASGYMPDSFIAAARAIWWLLFQVACAGHWLLEKMQCSKQVANRLLEPFTYVDVLVSGTEWKNFFHLRCGHGADPAFQQLADAMLTCYVTHKPRILKPGDWHLPYHDTLATETFLTPYAKEELLLAIKTCVSRAAKLSYGEFDGSRSSEKDVERYQRLLHEGHMSPFEHVAQAMHSTGDCAGEARGVTGVYHRFPAYCCANFTGFMQHRAEVAKPLSVDLRALAAERGLLGVLK